MTYFLTPISDADKRYGPRIVQRLDECLSHLCYRLYSHEIKEIPLTKSKSPSSIGYTSRRHTVQYQHFDLPVTKCATTRMLLDL